MALAVAGEQIEAAAVHGAVAEAERGEVRGDDPHRLGPPDPGRPRIPVVVDRELVKHVVAAACEEIDPERPPGDRRDPSVERPLEILPGCPLAAGEPTVASSLRRRVDEDV